MDTIIAKFNKRNVVLWTKDNKRYSGMLEVPAKGEFVLISQDGNPCEIAAIVRSADINRIELRRKRDFYAEKE